MNPNSTILCPTQTRDVFTSDSSYVNDHKIHVKYTWNYRKNLYDLTWCLLNAMIIIICTFWQLIHSLNRAECRRENKTLTSLPWIWSLYNTMEYQFTCRFICLKKRSEFQGFHQVTLPNTSICACAKLFLDISAHYLWKHLSEVSFAWCHSMKPLELWTLP